MSMHAVDLHAASSFDSVRDETDWSECQHSRALSGNASENPFVEDFNERSRFRPFVSEASVCAAEYWPVVHFRRLQHAAIVIELY